MTGWVKSYHAFLPGVSKTRPILTKLMENIICIASSPRLGKVGGWTIDDVLPATVGIILDLLLQGKYSCNYSSFCCLCMTTAVSAHWSATMRHVLKWERCTKFTEYFGIHFLRLFSDPLTILPEHSSRTKLQKGSISCHLSFNLGKNSLNDPSGCSPQFVSLPWFHYSE